ncbi:Small heat shock protein HSP16.5 [uncultured archaeon]|nr:Small heat shock protein HSP16.5 [uncultured archaeon]
MFRNWRKTEKGFFDQFEAEIEEMNETMNSMMKDLGDKPAVYGFSMQVGPDGVAHVEHFGNVRPMGQAVQPENNIREPFTSSMIDEKNGEFIITADMPGIGKEEIEVSATEDEVFIKAESGERKYYKNIKTPAPVDPGTSKAKYNNGVLEVTLKLKEPDKPKGMKVKIE